MGSRSFITGLLIALAVLAARTGAAHPLGNFSINHYSGMRVGKDSIELRYFIDMAEIPTFQEIQESGITPQVRDPGLEKYLARKVEALKDGLLLEINGQPLSLNAESKEVIFPAGAGGLPTMKIGIMYKAKIDGKRLGSTANLYYRDGNFPGRAGWKEVIVLEDNRIKFLSSSVPTVDRSSQLSDYPADLLNSPPQVLEARVSFSGTEPTAPLTGASEPFPVYKVTSRNAEAGESKTAGANLPRETAISVISEKTPPLAVAMIVPEVKTVQSSVRTEPIRLQANKQSTPRSSFTELMATKQLSLGIIFIALAIAVGLGAFHALEPGHGKSLVAAYLVGSRGTMTHALWLGLIVTAAHTAGVYLLGGITLYASQYILPERLYPWLTLASGVMILGLGVVLFTQRFRGKKGHSHHHHGHDHAHHHSRGGHSHHHHAPSGEVSLKELLALGISGGIVPCPAALVVLLSAVSMQRVGFGLLLIVAFSLGLAAVLIAIGLLMVYARRFMARFQMNGQLTTRWLPLTSSAFIILFGIALTWQALQTAGILEMRL
jgi:nickel/cobalt exporter